MQHGFKIGRRLHGHVSTPGDNHRARRSPPHLRRQSHVVPSTRDAQPNTRWPSSYRSFDHRQDRLLSARINQRDRDGRIHTNAERDPSRQRENGRDVRLLRRTKRGVHIARHQRPHRLGHVQVLKQRLRMRRVGIAAAAGLLPGVLEPMGPGRNHQCRTTEMLRLPCQVGPTRPGRKPNPTGPISGMRGYLTRLSAS